MRHRTLFLSDLHLGSRLTKADQLIHFLARNDAQTIYLVGDVFDLKRMRRRPHWPRSHATVVRMLRDKARAGTRIVCLAGNHDPDFRDRAGPRAWLPGLEVAAEAEHATADGRRLLVVHGDRHEPPRGEARTAFKLGCLLYVAGVKANERIAGVRRRLGLGWWSLSAFLKDRLLDRIEIARKFKLNLAADARARGFDGVVAGHIHHARIETIDGVLYANDGDWVESCTALAEDFDGRLTLIYWRGCAAAPAAAPFRRAEPAAA